jgi:AcrR family transcriptional regulator
MTQVIMISHKSGLHEMDGEVKTPRPYRSTRRAAQAEQTRRDILSAAGVLFRERGYGVPMAEIAARADVVVETVYRIFGTKAELFRAAVEALLAGGAARAEVPVEERAAVRAIRDEPDPRRQIAAYAATQPGIHRRSGPLLRALRDARATDPELGGLWDEMEAWRHEGQGRFVHMLADRGVLKPGLECDAGVDVTWTLCSLALYDLLVGERGWTDDRYQTWLTEALVRELLGDGSPTPDVASLLAPEEK